MSLANNSNDQDVPLQVSHFNFGGLPLELQDKIMSTVHNQDSGFTIRMKEIDEFYDDQGDPIDHGYYGRGINSMFLCGNKFLSNLAAQYVFGVSFLIPRSIRWISSADGTSYRLYTYTEK